MQFLMHTINMNRNSKNKLQLWIDDELSEKISDDCRDLGYRTKSELVRHRLNSQYVYVNFLKQLIFEKKKQGNNLNQIAYRLNKFDDMTADDLQYQLSYIAQKYDEILDEVRKLNDSKTD